MARDITVNIARLAWRIETTATLCSMGLVAASLLMPSRLAAQMLYPQVVPQYTVQPTSVPVEVPVEQQRRLGLVTIRTTHASGTTACSGTLLNRYWVLTAHHCIGTQSATGALLLPPALPGNVRVSATWTAASVQPTRIEHFSTNARIANYQDDSGHDLALLYLGQGDLGLVETDWYHKLWDGVWGRRLPGGSKIDLYGRGIMAWASRDASGNPHRAASDGRYRIQNRPPPVPTGPEDYPQGSRYAGRARQA